MASFQASAFKQDFSFPNSAWERKARSSASRPLVDSKRSFSPCVPKPELGNKMIGNELRVHFPVRFASLVEL